ncbi:non-specific lipid-transfer protein 13-like [Abrus precatorius]|uniref:Non-specific lipid-transfer protein 13-like n=1 Tax=Abrus precatorius TaxID=3816 RepID=A0A8B8KHS1_ABRPR|nr:non-specific lipid-transfer protein 13-like [Abrus precatorius]
MAMTRIAGILLLALSLVFVSHIAETTEVVPAAFSVCERIFEYFPYCLEFLVGDPNYDRPSKRCCQHITKLNILAHHRRGPRTICWCIQIMVKGMTPTLDPTRIQDLPLMCNTTLSFPISDSINCFKVG